MHLFSERAHKAYVWPQRLIATLEDRADRRLQFRFVGNIDRPTTLQNMPPTLCRNLCMIQGRYLSQGDLAGLGTQGTALSGPAKGPISLIPKRPLQRKDPTNDPGLPCRILVPMWSVECSSLGLCYQTDSAHDPTRDSTDELRNRLIA